MCVCVRYEAYIQAGRRSGDLLRCTERLACAQTDPVDLPTALDEQHVAVEEPAREARANLDARHVSDRDIVSVQTERHEGVVLTGRGVECADASEGQATETDEAALGGAGQHADPFEGLAQVVEEVDDHGAHIGVHERGAHDQWIGVLLAIELQGRVRPVRLRQERDQHEVETVHHRHSAVRLGGGEREAHSLLALVGITHDDWRRQAPGGEIRSFEAEHRRDLVAGAEVEE